MDSFNGYKLKPSSYQIQPNDIIIRVKNGTTKAPIGLLGISIGNNGVSFPKQPKWGTDYTDWRASEFPCFRKSITSKVIVKFTTPSEGTVVEEGESLLKLGHTSTWVEYDRTDVWTPCKDPSNQKASAESFTPFTIVDKKGNERTCVGLSKDNWYITQNPNGNSVQHNPLFWSKKEELKGNIEIANVASSISPHPIATVIAVDSMMNKPTQTKPNTKGKQMNSSLFTDMLKLLTQVEQTDLQKAPSAYAFFYNEDGEYEGTAKVANEAEAKALLQRPEHLGYTMRIYSFSDEFTTQIPVVSTIKKTVVAKPAIKPRKTRTPGAN